MPKAAAQQGTPHGRGKQRRAGELEALGGIKPTYEGGTRNARLNAILQVLTLVLLAIVGYGLLLLKTGTEAAVKTSAEEAAKATI